MLWNIFTVVRRRRKRENVINVYCYLSVPMFSKVSWINLLRLNSTCTPLSLKHLFFFYLFCSLAPTNQWEKSVRDYGVFLTYVYFSCNIALAGLCFVDYYLMYEIIILFCLFYWIWRAISIPFSLIKLNERPSRTHDKN